LSKRQPPVSQLQENKIKKIFNDAKRNGPKLHIKFFINGLPSTRLRRFSKDEVSDLTLRLSAGDI